MLEIHGTDHTLALDTCLPEHRNLEAFDNTKWAAINTCPTWGITRYQMHLRMPGGGRALALEAGHALHEVFSFVRLATLMDYLHDQGKDAVFTNRAYQFHGMRLFGAERMEHLSRQLDSAVDLPDVCRRGAIALLDTSGYYDDPRDKRRTLSNMEEAAYAYISRWRYDHPVWMRDYTDPTSDVGIELPFELLATVTGMHMHQFRFVGRIDGIHYDGGGY